MRGRSKYGNIKVEMDGILFDSKSEARRFQELQLLEKGGEIKELTVHPKFVLQEGFTDVTGKKQRPITYTPDFMYKDKDRNWQEIVEDVKGGKRRGTRTEVYRMKKKMFLKKFKIPLIET